MEGNDAAGFLRANLSKWIPSLRGRDIEIDRAHRVYDGGRGSDRPRTLIFRVLRWHDRSDILKGARCSVKCSQSNVTLLFFQQPLFLQLDGRGVTAGMDLVLAAQKGMIAGWIWTLAKPIFCVFFSPTWILSLFIRYNDLFAGKTDTPFFLFWRGLMESRFN